MSMSIDIEPKRTNPFHFATGAVVLTIAYVAILLAIAWARA